MINTRWRWKKITNVRLYPREQYEQLKWCWDSQNGVVISVHIASDIYRIFQALHACFPPCFCSFEAILRSGWHIIKSWLSSVAAVLCLGYLYLVLYTGHERGLALACLLQRQVYIQWSLPDRAEDIFSTIEWNEKTIIQSKSKFLSYFTVEHYVHGYSAHDITSIIPAPATIANNWTKAFFNSNPLLDPVSRSSGITPTVAMYMNPPSIVTITLAN